MFFFSRCNPHLKKILHGLVDSPCETAIQMMDYRWRLCLAQVARVYVDDAPRNF